MVGSPFNGTAVLKSKKQQKAPPSGSPGDAALPLRMQSHYDIISAHLSIVNGWMQNVALFTIEKSQLYGYNG